MALVPLTVHQRAWWRHMEEMDWYKQLRLNLNIFLHNSFTRTSTFARLMITFDISYLTQAVFFAVS